MTLQDPRPMVFQLLTSVAPKAKLVETVSFKVDKKKEKRFLELVNGMKSDSGKNPGAMTMLLHTLVPPNENYTEYFLYEVWEDRERLRRQWESDFLKVFQGKLMGEELLVAPPDLKFYLY